MKSKNPYSNWKFILVFNDNGSINEVIPLRADEKLLFPPKRRQYRSIKNLHQTEHQETLADNLQKKNDASSNMEFYSETIFSSSNRNPKIVINVIEEPKTEDNENQQNNKKVMELSIEVI